MKRPPTRPRPPTTTTTTPPTPPTNPAWVVAAALLLILLVAVGGGRAENSATSSSSSSTTTHGRGEWAAGAVLEDEEEEVLIEATPLPVTTPPLDSCPEDLCKITQLPEDRGVGVLSASPQVRVACHDDLRITSLKDIWPHCLPPTTRALDLSRSGLTRLPAGLLSHLSVLEKLDLKKNDISVIEPGAFTNLTSLRKLDLSSNGLSSLEASQMVGLHRLRRLKLARNPLARLQEGLLRVMEGLKSLDLAETQLVCDCGLTWLAQAVATKRLRLNNASRCYRPRALNGTQIRKLTPDQLQCHGPGLSVVELEPGLDQVVFAGDSLRLRCRVTSAEEGHKVWWARGDIHLLPRKPSANSSATVTGYLDQHHQRGGVTLKNTYMPDAIESMVEIRELNGTHSGDWSCLVQGEQGNHTRTVSIYVIAHDTKYCPLNMTSNNRGSYVWPRTVAGVKVELGCAGLVPSHQRGPKFLAKAAASVPSPRVAEHTCGVEGSWHALDTSACPFVSETTKILEQFAASTDLVDSKTSLVDSTRSLRNFTRDGKILRDAMDVVFLAKTVEQYANLLRTLSGPKETAATLIDIISASMAAVKDLLYAAEVVDGACRRLLNCLWSVTTYLPTLNRAAYPHIEMHQFIRQPDSSSSSSGLTCNWYRRSLHSTERYFRCNTNNYSLLYSDDEVIDAQIQVPSSLFSRDQQLKTTNTSEDDVVSPTPTVQLQFFVYDTANLFPRLTSDTWEVTSPVIGARVSDQEEEPLLEDSVYVALRSAIYSQNVVPVWWRQNATGDRGNWTDEGCKIVRILESLIVFRCNRLAHFGLLQDMAALQRTDEGIRGAEFRPSAPGVYVGSAVCILFLMASIVTWAAHHHRIAAMNKNKHSLMNTWTALLLLVTLFTVGVYQTENQQLCQGIGVALHYLTTCVLLWIIVTVTNLYKKVTKALRPPVPVEESQPDAPLPPKPMLRFYLVGWGIALILCGISAAVNHQQYAGYSYCFLAWGPSLGAFYAPTAALVFILSTFFLLTHCMLKSLRANYPEVAGATETTELELLDANSPNSENVNAPGEEELSIASRDTAVSVSDGQHSPLTQLRAHVVTLLLFILTWAAAAIATAAPFASVIPHHTTIFSIIYAVCASSLGIFIFVFFCASRNDVWEAWRECSCVVRRQSKEEEETHLTAPANNSGVNHATAANNQPRGPTVAPSTHSLDSSHTHQTNKSSSVSHSILTSNKPESLNKASNNLQLLSLGTMTNDLHYAPEIFYNPKQAGVAKRFFQKQRMRQMMKQNNLEINRTDSDCNSTVYKPKITKSLNSETGRSNFDTSCLGASSKVNNTNIHVDTMYAYIPSEFQKHASKDPTPEVLCVLGPSMDDSKMASLYRSMTVDRPADVDRGWATIPRKPRAFMEEPLSPMRRGGSFPSIVEEGQLTSQATSQSSALEQLPYVPPEPLHQQRLFNYPLLGQSTTMSQQLLQQYHNPRHHRLQEESLSRNDRNSFNSDRTDRSEGTGALRGVDHSRTTRHQKYRSGRERPRPGRNRRKMSRPRESCAHEDKDDWTDDNASPIIINHLPSGAGSSGSDKDGSPRRFVSYPQPVHSVSPPDTQRAVLQANLTPANPAPSAERTGEPPRADLTWPHVMNSIVSGDKIGRAGLDKSNCDCLHSAYSSNLEDPSRLPVVMCCGEGHDEDCDAWDSECGDAYWCDGGGEERVSACEVSGCENSGLCGGACGARGDLCGSESSEGGTSMGGASVDPAVGTSPRGSVDVSDSPYDSPLHRLHQNTPDSGSLDSGPLGSPGRPPYDPGLPDDGPGRGSPEEVFHRDDLPFCETYAPEAEAARGRTDDRNANDGERRRAETGAAESSGNSVFYRTNGSAETVPRDGEGVDESGEEGNDAHQTDRRRATIGGDDDLQLILDSDANTKRETCV